MLSKSQNELLGGGLIQKQVFGPMETNYLDMPGNASPHVAENRVTDLYFPEGLEILKKKQPLI